MSNDTRYIMSNDTRYKMSKPVLFLSFDVETDGPSPLVNNLLSIGIIGLEKESGCEVFEFESNIMLLDNHIPDNVCMETFWLKPEQKDAWEYLKTNKRNYIEVFEDLSKKLFKLANTYKLIWIAQPACFDWMFFKSYYELAKFNSSENFYDIGFKCTCISSLFDWYKNTHNLTLSQSTKLFNELGEFDNKNNHQALTDARVQGKFYIGLLKKMSE